MASSVVKPSAYALRKSDARVKLLADGVCLEVCSSAEKLGQLTALPAHAPRRRTFNSTQRRFTFMRTCRPHSSTSGE